MTIRDFVKGMMLLIFFSFFSCADEEQDSITVKSKIVCSVDEFITDNSSKTNTEPSNFSITWASGDVIGIFPFEGYQEPFEIPVDQIGQESATFDGGYWEVKMA